MPADESKPVTQDVEALKVFAHPLRLRLSRLLGAEGPATASTLARAVGATPSLVSYHLRAMAKFGFVVEAPEAGQDGRERYWKSAQDLRFRTGDFQGDDIGREASGTVLRVIEAERGERREDGHRRVHELGGRWLEASFSTAPAMRLTADELLAMYGELMEVVDRYRGLPEATDEGAPRERVLLEMYGFPYAP
jgi:DNA-binding transcriptional ArsR family regulator